MKIIEDCNFVGWVRIFLYLAGVGLLYLGLALEPLPRALRLSIFFIGFVTMLIGGFTSRAHTLKIKPFDNSYKKARKSYEVADDKQDDPK